MAYAGVFSLTNIADIIAAVGALGVAAYGAVESIGKTLFVFDTPWFGVGKRSWGLPYVGFSNIRRLVKPLEPALKIAYGDGYETIIKQQYRDGRSQGKAPETIRQGVRLGLPFLSLGQATAVIAATWGMDKARAVELAAALTGEKTPEAPTPSPDEIKAYQTLAGRFSTALDTRVDAAFALAEQVYGTRARIWAGVVAIALSLGYHAATTSGAPGSASNPTGGWFVAFLIGLVAVPLAPAAKDLATSISDALGALSKIRAGGAQPR